MSWMWLSALLSPGIFLRPKLPEQLIPLEKWEKALLLCPQTHRDFGREKIQVVPYRNEAGMG